MSESNATINNIKELNYLKSLTLLCVEDNKTTQLLYSSIFEDIVANLFFADDGIEGFEKFNKNEIDIIITDYNMPNLNGIGMIKQIRKIDQNIPIILVSAIEDIDVIIEALNLNVSNFLKKPTTNDDAIKALVNSSKVLMLEDYIEKDRKKEIELLTKHKNYSSYQEELAFQKELNIIKNDFYYQMQECPEYTALVDFLYKPLDILSGDSYSARKIDISTSFFFIIDGMGKGVSASLTAMILTSHINNLVDNMIENSNFSLEEIVNDSMKYIQKILLDEEAVAIDYISLNSATNEMEYAKFAMPKFILQDSNENIIYIKSNNPPLSKYQIGAKISKYDVSNILKFLFYSDGLVENETLIKEKLYFDFIEQDFVESFLRNDLREKIFEKIDKQEDDITLIFINKINFENRLLESKQFNSTMEDMENANEWYTALWENISSDTTLVYNAGLVFTELYMNAYEHGNLDITKDQKEKLLEEDIYFETLLEKEKIVDKKIDVEVYKIQYHKYEYIVTKIIDEGEGFDTQTLSDIFRHAYTFNGRGVFLSRESSVGIYYTKKGNSVLFFHKLRLNQLAL
ncbi:MAG: response regulator [Helicobacteraceae bacterium]|nr:response regulator [Helicobacteraceae bacterium]